MKTPEIDKLISTLEYQVNVELFTTPKKVNLLEELKKLKQVNNVVLDAVSKCYTEKDMDNAYDKGFKDGNQRDLTGSLIEVL
jgi:glutamate racemase